ncbi:MAG: glycosyl transferase, WecB/TagA/CpsF family [Betaproteobacteria bacterium]|nr:glycosyl transferase, WecB/TagA/CpsF family [Betaproteobacteria bacterium]
MWMPHVSRRWIRGVGHPNRKLNLCGARQRESKGAESAPHETNARNHGRESPLARLHLRIIIINGVFVMRTHTLPIAAVDFNFVQASDIPPLIDLWRHDGRRGYVTLVNPHSVMMCRRDERMREATRGADLALPDGVGVVLAARLLGYGRRYRVTGPALMLHLCDAGRVRGLRHFFFGGRVGVAEQLVEHLSVEYPGLEVAGTYCPPFRALADEEDAQVVAHINATRPDVVWVGMGAPKQEKWMADHVGRIRATALVGVGAAFDFHSGNVPWAPRWVRRIGCEWAYRLAREPRRMWRRNLDSPLFLWHVGIQAVASLGGRIGRILQPVLDRGLFDDLGGGGGGAAGAGGGSPPAIRAVPRSDALASTIINIFAMSNGGSYTLSKSEILRRAVGAR